ncbi:MAG: DUF2281 domain-containing protein [Treponema sp.]|jgi:hypothetical protein|nr:DUF2281 domain-containing protein [Treponema sp.]
MSNTEVLIKEIETLPGDCVAEVLDFVGYLKQKHAPAETGIDGECPLDHTPNAVTIAAIEEGRAMMRGEIPANRFNSLEEMLEALKS